MPFTPIADCWKVELVGHHSVTLTPIVNVLHALDTTPHTLATATGLAIGAEDAFHGRRGAWPDEFVWDFARATDAASDIGPQYTSVVFAGEVGTAGHFGGSQVSVLIKLLTAFRGRSYRGRIFIPAVSTVAGTNTPDAAQVAQVDNIPSDLNTNWGALPSVPVLAVGSRKLGTCHAVQSWSVEPSIATQRRRVGR